MRYADIIALASQKGLQDITTHDVPVEHSYKVFKFKAKFNALLKAYNDSRAAIVKEVGIEDEERFGKELEALEKAAKPTDKEVARLAEMKGQRARLNKMTAELLNEEVSFDGIKAMPYEAWKALQDENKATDKRPEMLSGIITVVKDIREDGAMQLRTEDVEALLEGILWNAPTEE